MFSAALEEKITGSCGTRPIVPRKASGTTSRMSMPSTRMRALVGIVEAHQQLDDRGLAGAGRADDGDGLAGRDLQIEIVERLRLRPRRIMEGDVVEFDAPGQRPRQMLRQGRCRDDRAAC